MKLRSASRETSRQCHASPRALLIFPRDSFRWVFIRVEGSEVEREKEAEREKAERGEERERERENAFFALSWYYILFRGKFIVGGLKTANREIRKSRRKRKHTRRTISSGNRLPRRGITLLLYQTTASWNGTKTNDRPMIVRQTNVGENPGIGATIKCYINMRIQAQSFCGLHPTKTFMKNKRKK